MNDVEAKILAKFVDCKRNKILERRFFFRRLLVSKTLASTIKIFCYVLDFMYILQRPQWINQGEIGF